MLMYNSQHTAKFEFSYSEPVFKASHKKSYLIDVEFLNCQIHIRNLYFDFFSTSKAETANWAETAA